jgi:hypothetical protein
MKKLLISAATAAAFAIPASAIAATTNSGFNVTATLTSVCTATNSGSPTIAFGTYTAFGAAIGPVTVTPGVTFQCTRGLPTPTAAFDSVAPGTTTGGVINGLQYTLSAPAGSKTTTGTAATAGSIGSADVYTYTFDGTLPAGQAGDPTQTPGPVTRTLTITY